MGEINGDTRNDIAVLRNDGVLVVALAVAAPPANGPYFGATSTYTMVSGPTTPGSSFELADIATATTIAWRKNDGSVMAVCGNGGAGFGPLVEPRGKTLGVTAADGDRDEPWLSLHTKRLREDTT